MKRKHYELWTLRSQKALYKIRSIYQMKLGEYEYATCPLCSALNTGRKLRSCEYCPWFVMMGFSCCAWVNAKGIGGNTLRHYKAQDGICYTNLPESYLESLIQERIETIDSWIEKWERVNGRK